MIEIRSIPPLGDTSRRCASCRHFAEFAYKGAEDIVHRVCEYPLPLPRGLIKVNPGEGMFCPTWAAKEEPARETPAKKSRGAR